MKRMLVMVAMLILLAQVAYAEVKTLSWAGCGITKKAFMKELADAYEKKTGVKVELKGGGATKGIRLPAEGKVDMGGSCRHKIDDPEEKNAKMHHVAWDALIVIANKDNPVSNLTTEQAKSIFTGKIKNWKEVGGSDAPIKFYEREGKISGVGLMTRELIFGDPNVDYVTEVETRKDTGPIEAEIARDVNAVAADGVSSAQKRDDIKVLTLDGVAPTKENIMKGKYTYFRPLYLVTGQNPSEDVKKFLEFAMSAEGQSIIAAQGTVNLAEGKDLLKLFKGKIDL